MESEGSLPCSQEPAIFLYPEPGEYSLFSISQAYPKTCINPRPHATFHNILIIFADKLLALNNFF
jgi:hypothetical protein